MQWTLTNNVNKIYLNIFMPQELHNNSFMPLTCCIVQWCKTTFVWQVHMDTMVLSIRFLCSRSLSSSWNLVCCRKLTMFP